MRSVSIVELEDGLKLYLRCVQDGEEILVSDESVPVARIIPFRPPSEWDLDSRPIAAGAITMPEKELDRDLFSRPLGGREIPTELVMEALDWARGAR